MKASPSKAEMLNDVKNLHRFFYVANFRLFCDDQVNINIGMDEVSICAATHSSLNAHEAVLLYTHNTDSTDYMLHSCCSTHICCLSTMDRKKL